MKKNKMTFTSAGEGRKNVQLARRRGPAKPALMKKKAAGSGEEGLLKGLSNELLLGACRGWEEACCGWRRGRALVVVEAAAAAQASPSRF